MIFQKMSGLITLKQFSMGMLQPKLRREQVQDIPRTMRKVTMIFLMLIISELEVKNAIQRLRSGKAAAVDGILTEMLKAA